MLRSVLRRFDNRPCLGRRAVQQFWQATAVLLTAETATVPPTTAKASAKARMSFFIEDS
jgi:hypothetical protein